MIESTPKSVRIVFSHRVSILPNTKVTHLQNSQLTNLPDDFRSGLITK